MAIAVIPHNDEITDYRAMCDNCKWQGTLYVNSWNCAKEEAYMHKCVKLAQLHYATLAAMRELGIAMDIASNHNDAIAAIGTPIWLQLLTRNIDANLAYDNETRNWEMEITCAICGNTFDEMELEQIDGFTYDEIRSLFNAKGCGIALIGILCEESRKRLYREFDDSDIDEMSYADIVLVEMGIEDIAEF
jgi:hypothetical protein